MADPYRFDVPQGDVEIYTDEAGAFRWRLFAGNGEQIAQGESHPTFRNALRAAKRATLGPKSALDCPDL